MCVRTQFDAGVFLRAGPVRLYVPVQISHLQFKVQSDTHSHYAHLMLSRLDLSCATNVCVCVYACVYASHGTE